MDYKLQGRSQLDSFQGTLITTIESRDQSSLTSNCVVANLDLDKIQRGWL
jgi:hypothetical protein